MKFKQSLGRPSRLAFAKKSDLQTILFIAVALVILTALYVPGWLNLRQVKGVPKIATQNYFPKKSQPTTRPQPLTIAGLVGSNKAELPAASQSPPSAQIKSSPSVKVILAQPTNDLLVSSSDKIRPAAAATKAQPDSHQPAKLIYSAVKTIGHSL